MSPRSGSVIPKTGTGPATRSLTFLKTHLLPWTLAVSLGLNAAQVWRRPVAPRSGEMAQGAPELQKREGRKVNPLVTREEEEANRISSVFHWSQIETPDFPTFIQNLRKIGCPEATVQSIVKAELDEIYAERSRAMPARTHATQVGVASETQRLVQEEAAELSRLMSPQPAAISVVDRQSRSADIAGQGSSPPVFATSVVGPVLSSSATAPRSAAKLTPQMPLIYENVNPSSAPSDETTTIALNTQRQQFVDAVGGNNQNPDDPKYLAAWLKAQSDSDQLLWTTLGANGYNEYMRQRAMNAGN